MAAGEQLRLSRAQRTAIQKLATDRTRLGTEHEQALKKLSELAEQHQAEQAALAALPPPRETGSMELALGQARDQGDLDGALETARTRLAQATQQAARSLSQLALWDGTLEALEAAGRRPPRRSIASRPRPAQVEAERDQMRKARQKAVDERVEAEGTIELLRQSTGTVPTEDDLARALAERDRLWTIIRQAWEDGRLPSAGGLGDLLEPDQDPVISPKLLADRFERLKDQADSHADRLRREAERVAQQASALASLHRSRQRLEFLDAQERILVRRGEDFSGRWRAAWAGLGHRTPLAPRDAQAGSRFARTSSRSPPRSRSGAARSWPRTQARRVPQTAGPGARRPRRAHGGPRRVVGRLAARPREAALEQLGQVEARRSKLVELEGQAAAAARDRHRSRFTTLEQRLDAWRDQWAAAVAPLGLAADVTTEHAGAMVDQVAELQARIKEARDLQARIAGLRRDAEQFGRDVRDVCKRVAPELTPDDAPGSPSLEMAASELLRRLRVAGEARTARDALVEQREAQVATARDAEAAARGRGSPARRALSRGAVRQRSTTCPGRRSDRARPASSASAQGARRTDPGASRARVAGGIPPGGPRPRPGPAAGPAPAPGR